MKHQGTVMLETDRLILRKFTIEDIEPAFQNWTSDADTTKYLTWPTHTNVETTKKVISEYWISNYNKPDFYQWAIELKEISEPVGTISVVEMREEIDMVEIGYCIGSKWWHRGIMTEAFAVVIKYLFEQVKVNRIQAKYDPVNVNSGKVMLRCGLTFEGTLRQADRNNTGIADAAVYAMLAEDYFGV